ncbi:hypothetical protein [Ammoniphilus sp. 3BR4]
MNILFRFNCSCCGKEKLTDSVLLKCCDKLMTNVGHVIMSDHDLQRLKR